MPEGKLARILVPMDASEGAGRAAAFAVKGDVIAELAWKRTPALHRTRDCLFLYNDDTTSNLLPLRLLTDAQAKAVETWFGNSRAAYKEYQKKEDRQARQKFREDHPGLRLGRTGPAWGPWKRKK